MALVAKAWAKAQANAQAPSTSRGFEVDFVDFSSGPPQCQKVQNGKVVHPSGHTRRISERLR